MPADHWVGRLDVTVAMGNTDQAHALRPQLEAMAWRLFPDVIERVFNRLAPADSHLVIDRLDLDLGTVRPAFMEADAIAALEAALEEAIGAAMHGVRHADAPNGQLVAPVAWRLQRLAAYLATGSLPDRRATAPFDLNEALAAALADDAGAVVALLQRQSRNSAMLDRLVLQLGEDGLRRLLAALAPADAATILGLIGETLLLHRLAPAEELQRVAPPALRHLLWVTTLDFLLNDAGSQFNRRRFLEALLVRAAVRMGITLRMLLALLAEALAIANARTPLRSTLPRTLAELLAEQRDGLPGDAGTFPFNAASVAIPGDPVFGLAERGPGESLSETDFARLLAQHAPAVATTITEGLDQLIAAWRALSSVPEPVGGLDMVVRRLALSLLAAQPASALDLAAFWLAVSARIVDAQPDLAARLVWHEGRLPDPIRTALATLARQTPAGGAALRREQIVHALQARDHDTVLAAVAALAAAERSDVITPDLQVLLAAQLPDAPFAQLLQHLGSAGATGAAPNRPARARLQSGRPQRRAARVRQLQALLSPNGRRAAETPPDQGRGLNALITGAGHEGVALPFAVEEPASGQATQAATVSGQTPPGRRDHVIAARPWGNGVPADPTEPMALGSLANHAPPSSPLGFEPTAGESPDGAGAADAHRDPALPGTRTLSAAAAAALAAYLAGGAQVAEAAQLPILATEDPAALAAVARRAAALAGADVVASRLLDWLLPEDLLAVLVPATAVVGAAEERTAIIAADAAFGREADISGVAAAHGHVADIVAADVIAASMAAAAPQSGSDAAWWRAAIAALLAGQPLPAGSAAPALGQHADRLAALTRWLAGGAPPAGAGAVLLALSSAERMAVLAGTDADEALARLCRAAMQLAPAALDALLAELAPWAASNNGALASLLAGRDPAARQAIRLRAAAGALAGTAVDMVQLVAALPPMAEASAALADGMGPNPNRAPNDLTALLAWLDGRAAPSDTSALEAQLIRRLDAGDQRLTRWLMARRSRPRDRERWAAILPVPALVRVLQLLAPGAAHALHDGLLLITSAASQVLPFGSARPQPRLLWQMLLDAVAMPARVDVPVVLGALVKAVSGDDPKRASQVRAQALKRASDSGHVRVAAALRRKPSAPPPPSTPAPPSANAPANAHPSFSLPQKAAAAERPWYVGNAGLVLLHPFIPTLFERLGLLVTDATGRQRLEPEAAASRACHLLQYLVDGRLDAPEPELVLNKLLCGLPTGVPVARSLEPEPGDLTLCDDLLGAVIANWPALSNTSAAGLQETFLQREGRLQQGNGKWTLQVQRRTLDVLMSQVPWGISIVYCRWMPEPLHVTW